MAKKEWKNTNKGGASGPIYGLGFIGGLIYFLHVSFGFWGSVLAILKAFVWPAFVVHKILGL